MLSSVTTFCCLLLFLTTECYHQRPKLRPKVDDTIQGLKEKLKTRNFKGQCQGICMNGSHCHQSCEKPFHGEIGFMCSNKKWQKSIETCTSLTVQTLFQTTETSEISTSQPSLSGGSRFSLNSPSELSYEEPIESAAQGIRMKCPDDYACIINGVKSSEATSGNIAFIVELLKNISMQLSENVNWRKMQSFSSVANHVLNRSVVSNWAFIPQRNASSILLQSVNSFAKNLKIHDEPENTVHEPFIQTKGVRISHKTQEKSFNFSMRVTENEDVQGIVFIPWKELQKLPDPSPAISIAFPTLGAILEEAHLQNESFGRQVNGLILSVILPEKLKQVLFTFEKINKSPGAKAQCVAWHSWKRKWVEEACETTVDAKDKATCRCNYTSFLMSFSILMSPKTLVNKTLDYITCIGLSISILSLILCLMIEITVWSQVTATEISYMRHVCIVNIATSLLIANVWFIVASFFDGAAWSYSWCVAVTFFNHYFYLSLFFWMLIKALLILYGILIVFRRMMKSAMMATAFSVGYGCPLIIAAITVAVTEPRKAYVRTQACWLNWDNSRALLAFVIPALTIVAVNLIVVFVVAINTRRPSIGSPKSQDMVTIMRISKNVAILTPLLGLTWGFGIATLIGSSSLVFHIIFSLLNAFQGFFILLFGTILDQKTREALKVRMLSLKGKSRTDENSKYNPNHGSKLVARSG
ncbi:adhesion G protein-coupled receptor F4 isoform X1 [Monodelphis domestica]|uniref:adhesion G protein-coupled receptor F4 isoform X1 n=2 Tax=Monodelphis domestica TaxID=13616 RepID=UPI0024E20185|nr:adhesion G protein-coupled receptor F4 isoform X1 [Monodelphis domestica]XP_007484113.2 adhesion G protein-coupled receptor F4 isoform X1 [Monodelphis domestica]XP_007484114.2 adhesion G protein-coupled receptor F4 isoform X1 [Monodelphis domestica]XP_056674353.1 adhesion G protein-coupled receptor F4 isoform X1 [Monodelphis domestica]